MLSKSHGKKCSYAYVHNKELQIFSYMVIKYFILQEVFFFLLQIHLSMDHCNSYSHQPIQAPKHIQQPILKYLAWGPKLRVPFPFFFFLLASWLFSFREEKEQISHFIYLQQFCQEIYQDMK